MTTDTFNFRIELASSLNGSTLLTMLGTLNLIVAIVGGIGVHNENAPIGEHFNYMSLLICGQLHKHLYSEKQL